MTNTWHVDVSQLNIKKYVVYGAIAFIWIAIPTFEITSPALTSDIVKGTCRRFVVNGNYAMAKTLGFFSVFIGYLLPLALMVFCYARVVRALRSKVSLSLSEP